MKLEFTEIEKLEQLAAETTSIEGATWITLQVVDHILNSINKRDSLNNKYIPGLVTDFLEQYDSILSNDDAIRPIPNDIIHLMIDYTENVIEHLIHKPKGKMIKVDSMIPSYKLKSAGSKTMNWISKQPGRTVKEKLCGKNKVLTQTNEFSYDIKENQVLSTVVKELTKLINTRINLGINNEAYDISDSDCERFDKLESFLRLEKKYKKSKLGQISSTVVTQPNNALISDKYYSKVWRAYQQILEYKRNIDSCCKYALERYTICVFWAILSDIFKVNGVLIENEINWITESDGEILIKKLNKGNFEKDTTIKFIISPNDNGLNGKIVMINKEKQFGFIKTNEDSYYLGKKNLKDQSLFDSLELGQHVFFKIKDNGKSEVRSIEIDEEIYIVELSTKDTSIYIDIHSKKYLSEYSKFIDKKVQKLTYTFNVSPENTLSKGRGINLNINKFIHDKLQDKWKFNCYADIKGIKGTKNVIVSEILSSCSINNQKHLNINNDNNDKSFLAIDFIANKVAIKDNKLQIFNSPKQLHALQVLEESVQKTYVTPTNVSINTNYQVISLNDLLTSHHLSQGEVTEGVNLILNSLNHQMKTYLTNDIVYSVPDSIDEFSQKNMKRLLRVNFDNAFPIWRSVAGTTSSRSNLSLDNESKILVIDCNGDTTTTVLLKPIYNHKVGDYIFERYAPYDCNDENNPINQLSFSENYLLEYLKKYNLTINDHDKENILKLGFIENILSTKTDVIHRITENNTDIYIKICYDPEIHNIIYNKFVSRFKEYIKSLKDSTNLNGITQLILISDHLELKYNLKSFIESEFKFSQNILIQNSDVVDGLIELKNRLLNNLPTWYEHLPDLSLEVIKDFHYDKLNLIKNKSVENIMGKEQLFEVDEILTLEAAKKEYKFPLLKTTAGKTNTEFNAVIKDKSFPLKENLDVKLTVKYIYGNDNSYELLIEPLDKNQAVFKMLTAEWIEEIESASYNPYPHFADVVLTEKDTAQLEAYIGKLERLFERKFIYFYIEERDLTYTRKLIFKIMKIIQKLAYNSSNSLELIYNIKTRPLVQYMGMLIGIIDDKGLIQKMSDVNKKDTKLLISTAAEFLCCFGSMIIPSVKNYILSNNESYKASSLGKMIFLNGEDTEILNAFEESFKTNSNHIIRSSGKSLWADKELILNLYKNKPTLIVEIVNFIEYRLKKLANDNNPSPTLFKDFSEVLLAIIRLRELDNFSLLKVGSTRALRLSKYVKLIDSTITKNNGIVRSFIKFDLDKPETLKNMSDLAYVLNVYLTGDEGANLIQVKTIDD